MKIVAVLRDPVERAYSAYWFARRNGWEDTATFSEALEVEDERAHGDYKERAELTYRGHGEYVDQLHSFRKLFGRDRMLLLTTGELMDSPNLCVERVRNLLGLETNEASEEVAKGEKHNVSGMPRIALIHRVLQSPTFRKMAGAIFSEQSKNWLRHRLLNPMLRLNTEEQEYAPMKDAVRRRLIRYFRSYNRRLAEDFGVDVSAWSGMHRTPQ